MNIEELKKQEEALVNARKELLPVSAMLHQAINKELADVREQIAKLEAEPKGRFVEGQTYFRILGNGDYAAWAYRNAYPDRKFIEIGNAASTIEEAERIIRRRKAVVKYNEMVERENSICRRTSTHLYYINKDKSFTACHTDIGTDLQSVHADARGCVLAQLTPELINDLFC
jgi:hypothetical protein